MREGVCGVIRYSVAGVYDAVTSRKFVLGVATNTRYVSFTRVDFTTPDIPVKVTTQRLLDDSLTVVQPGLVSLVRLFTAPIEEFGWPDNSNLGNPADIGLASVRLLGSGGFADVLAVRPTDAASDEVRAAATGAPDNLLAYKTAQDPSATQSLSDEADILSALNAACVPHVPTLVAQQRCEDGDGAVVALVMTPVAKSLLSYVTQHADRARDVAALLLRDVLLALKGAWSAGVVHGDVRPSNMVVVLDDDNPQEVVLIDWGLGDKSKARSVTQKYGDPCFFPCARLQGAEKEWHGTRSDAHRGDLVALGYSYLAVRGFDAMNYPPWRGMLMVSRECLMTRSEWFSNETADGSARERLDTQFVDELLPQMQLDLRSTTCGTPATEVPVSGAGSGVVSMSSHGDDADSEEVN